MMRKNEKTERMKRKELRKRFNNREELTRMHNPRKAGSLPQTGVTKERKTKFSAHDGGRVELKQITKPPWCNMVGRKK